MEQSLVQRLSGLGSLNPVRHPFLGLQRSSSNTNAAEKPDIRVTDSKDDDNDDDDDDLADDDEKRKKKKTRTVFSRSQVSRVLNN